MSEFKTKEEYEKWKSSKMKDGVNQSTNMEDKLSSGKRGNHIKYNSEFPALSTIAKITKATGWLLVVVAICLLGYALIEPTQTGHHWGSGNIILITGSLISVIAGLLVKAFAEIIGVMLAIEFNTRNK